ncbi:MAG: MtrB/PioB family outer membrane beta-barrel protein [Vicinamibacterales bacterium]
MRTRVIMAAAWVLAFATLAAAQDPPTRPAPTDPVDVKRSALTGEAYGRIDFGGRFNSVDGDEARYQRYRDLRPGIYATEGLFGRRGPDWTLEAQAWNIGYRDQKFDVAYNYVGRLEANFLYDQIPLFFSRDTRTLYSETAPGVLRIDDAIQQSVQSGSTTLRDFQDVATRFDLRVRRYVTQMDVVFNASRDTDLYFNVRSVKRSGEMPYGATFGFSNAVEVAAPVDTRTSDFKTALEWANRRGLIRVGWDGSWYNNDVQTLIWDNPLRFAPDAAGNPTQGRLALWPDNTLNYLHGQAAVNFARSGRLSGYVAIGQGKSNADLLPHTINTALASPELSRSTAQAEHRMSIAQFNFSMRPVRKLSVVAKGRRADVDVRTPEFLRDTGDVTYDATLRTAPAHASEYYSVTRNTFDADAAFEVLPFTSLKAGVGVYGAEYTNRIFDKTNENVFRLSLDTTSNPYVMLRALYENRSRDGEGFESEILEEVGELAGLRHFDVADRDRQRFTLIASFMPGSIVGVTGSAGVGRDKYPNSAHGLLNADTNQYSVAVDLVPNDMYSFTASVGLEQYTSLQRSRNANNAADQANPLRDWTTDWDGDVKFFDFSLDVAEPIERTHVRLGLDWTKSKDTYLYGTVDGSLLTAPEQLPPVLNELLRGEVDVTYDISDHVRFGVAYWYDDYNVQDFALGPTTLTGIALPPVQPGQGATATNALLLGYLYRPYTAHTGFVRLTYLF